ncbi:Uncharacterized protein PECH_007830 [Penicillium ucsense]|uniref:Small nuclear ribonucleoprotein Prp3 C-terminal domain-containing protein n=1 Tax=Penicillium ucsense TaxID=2839758 RepID=A0A8J8W336_9EURO|nr:Uncharacterized protein PECM_007651 [Penicillium ucsense]KAF7734640.1 Uncharacterized protein PECH_007830 [Penicillium ucsense]
MNSTILPVEVIEAHLATIDLIAAMYPSSGEVEISESSAEWIDRLREWCLDPTSALAPAQIPPTLSVTVRLPVGGQDKTIQVIVTFPLRTETEGSEGADRLPPMRYSLRQPDWMSKAEVAALSAGIPNHNDDALEAFDYIQAEGARLRETKQTQTVSAEGPDATKASSGPLVRVWFYFPSLSTRKKRDDMVNLAPGYGLTGFVLAGKPGVLCLEGLPVDIDAYMSFIKTHSWGDIPSHQKKVSERFRETENIQRVFPGMEEITDSLGARGGQRANRGDMQALEAWLGERGLQRAFEQVIF